MSTIPNAYWVCTNKVMAGPYPAHPIMEDQTRQQLAWLLEQGITHMIDLTAPAERASYESLFTQTCQRYGIAGAWQRYAITDFGIPSHELMSNILNQIDAINRQGGVVYLHCYGGVGRTGTVAACYLIRHGLPAEKALAKLGELRVHTPNARYASPETDAQRDFVLGWKIAQ